MDDKKILVFIPTYNERGNVEKLFNEIESLKLNVDFLFIDDNSPDGTGEIIDDLARKHANVNVVHRPRKLGIGSAHIDGINWAYDHQYATLITMDCDFSHQPKYIPDFVGPPESCDVVVGSRYLSSKGTEGWNLPRKMLTSMGHIFTKLMLRLDVDATGAYRLYRLDRIPRGIFNLAHSKDYSFFFESLYLLNANGVTIKEIPITLPARNLGHSKLTMRQMVRWFEYLSRMSLLDSFDKGRFEVPGKPADNVEAETLKTENDWDEYWDKKNDMSGRVYDGIAVFYRKYIIKRNLNRFIKRHFPDGHGMLLHAGCGSGEVDSDILKTYQIVPLDLSLRALALNKNINNVDGPLVRGNIFSLPFADSSFDGIYNLGVMEHFSEKDIDLILQEFRRVVKPAGKIVLFWPPSFGLTVMVLKPVHFVLNRVLARTSKLHPDEITRIESKAHIESIVDRAGLKMVEQSFSIRDLFTYYVVVCEKQS